MKKEIVVVDPGSEAKGLPSELAFVARVHLTPELEANLLGRANTSVVEANPFAQKARAWLVRSK